MPRHTTYVPHGVIPAVLLPFQDDLSIDETNFRAHLCDVASVEGLSAITVNAHSTEVGSCSFDEQKRVLTIAGDTGGGTLTVGNRRWGRARPEDHSARRRSPAAAAPAPSSRPAGRPRR